MSTSQFNDLMRLHSLAVKAAVSAWAATPGTRNKARLDNIAERAETRFLVALSRHVVKTKLTTN